jgi:hypothetical protein
VKSSRSTRSASRNPNTERSLTSHAPLWAGLQGTESPDSGSCNKFVVADHLAAYVLWPGSSSCDTRCRT